jgi:outer membrane protein OmpA-like peptidoglycan-associated protein
MRCETMNQAKAQGCKLFSALKKPNGQWDEPKELPASINTGNSQTPRIMADSETLIFSSDKLGQGKGGMDLYVTRLINGSWSTPRPLDFVNTEKDDQFVSVAALGRYLLKDAPGKKTNELIEFLFPEDIRPRGMMKIEGKVTDAAGAPIPAYVSVSDLSDGRRVFTGRPDQNGSYALYLREGTQYELAVDPEQSNVSFFTRRFDLTTDKTPQRERVSTTLKPVAEGDELLLENVGFDPHSAQLLPASEEELKRLARLVKAVPELAFEIQVMMTGYREDSIQSDPDLTEVFIDSLLTQYDDIDSVGQLFQRDTLLVDTTYHNDRTHRQAESIVQYLVAQGAEPSRFIMFGNAIPAALPEEQKLIVKAVARRRQH